MLLLFVQLHYHLYLMNLKNQNFLKKHLYQMNQMSLNYHHLTNQMNPHYQMPPKKHKIIQMNPMNQPNLCYQMCLKTLNSLKMHKKFLNFQTNHLNRMYLMNHFHYYLRKLYVQNQIAALKNKFELNLD